MCALLATDASLVRELKLNASVIEKYCRMCALLATDASLVRELEVERECD